MPAYLVAHITVLDPEGFAEYRAKMPELIAKFGGRYLIRGGAIDVVEAPFEVDRMTVVEYPSMEMARACYESADYAPLLALRQRTTRSHVALIEGFTP
jgi:uncharacterized protein (DUF1330 family)